MAILGAAVLPHPPLVAGTVAKHGEKKLIEQTINAYNTVAETIAELKPQTIVLISPHTAFYADYFHVSPSARGELAYGDFSRFGDSKTCVEVKYDEIFIKILSKRCRNDNFPCGTLGEREKDLDHGVTVPLYFVQKKYKDFKLVRLGLSSLPLSEHYELGMKIAELAVDLKTDVFVIASGDLSHKLLDEGPYGYAAEGPEYDAKVMKVLESAAFDELIHFDERFLEKVAECGHRSFCIMAGVFDGVKVKTEKLAYEGPFGVGYGSLLFKPTEKDKNRHFLEQHKKAERKRLSAKRSKESPYVQLARLAIETFVKKEELFNVSEYEKYNIPLGTEAFAEQAGCFVSLKKNGQLRGCIGTIVSTKKNIAEEIVSNALSSACCDTRFQPVRPDELTSLEYSVDILFAPERIESEQELDVKRYGVIVSSGFKRGILLPNLEGVDTVETQVAIAKRKAGILPHEKVTLERFEVVRYE